MCLFPKLIRNPKYIPNKKNKGIIPQYTDSRVLYVAVGCGHCIECRQQKARQWKIRLLEEIKNNKENKYFVTLTLSNESIEKLRKIRITKDDNEIISIAIRRFLERWRKKYKKSVKHWFVTELGETNTERIHVHGIILTEINLTEEILNSIWKYGIADIGEYVNKKTINYIVKYIMKKDILHPNYMPDIFCSAGLGKKFTEDNYNKRNYKYKPKESREYYLTDEGYKLNLPIYYRNKLYSEEEREKLWIDRLDKKEIYIMGTRYDISTIQGQENYEKALKEAQKENEKMGYGNENWHEKNYRSKIKELNKKKKYNDTNNN